MRLEALESSSSGFEIAEHDLDIRGEGDLVGTRQSGLPTFKTGNLLRDRILMEDARREAVDWIKTSSRNSGNDNELLNLWNDRFRLMEIG